MVRIFFETHFNALLNNESPRQRRMRELEDRLDCLRLPPYLKHKVRRTWERNESALLRNNRRLANTSQRPVKIGMYQVVKVLGSLWAAPWCTGTDD